MLKKAGFKRRTVPKILRYFRTFTFAAFSVRVISAKITSQLGWHSWLGAVPDKPSRAILFFGGDQDSLHLTLVLPLRKSLT